MNYEIKRLAKHYDSKYSRDDTKQYLSDLYDHYIELIKRKQQTLIDAAAATAVIGGLAYADTIDHDAIDPQMQEAFELAFPGKSIDSLSDYNPEQLEGIVSAWKGKYFEVLVRDKLNAGEWVGDIHLEPGQVATIADSPVQEGWDLQILNADGTVAQELQLKATESLSYVQEAIVQNPDIEVMTTDEVSSGVDGILSSGMKEADLEASIRSPMEDLLDSPLEELAENLLPGLPFLIITTREGRKVMVGKQSFSQGLEATLKESAKTGAAITMGAVLFYLTDMGIISIPATFLTRTIFKQAESKKLIKSTFKSENERIHPLLAEYRR